MAKEFVANPNRPIHLYSDNDRYFITAAIYEKRRLLADPSLKILVFELIQKYFEKYEWDIHHWVVLDNHYHVIGRSKIGRDMSLIIQGIHGCSAATVRKATGCELPVWWNYWDYCPRNEADYMTRVNYLLNNPVKHGYVRKLTDYPFSTFHRITWTVIPGWPNTSKPRRGSFP